MKTTCARNQRGVTLIELMIGLAIGVLVVLAVLSLLLNMTHASARVVQTQDVSDAVRTGVGIVERSIAEAGFGIRDSAPMLLVSSTPTRGTVTNAARTRVRYVTEPLNPALPTEIRTCDFFVRSPSGSTPALVSSCGVGTVAPVEEVIVSGAVAFEVHSGCASGPTNRVERYRRGECESGEVRRSMRIAMLLRASAADPVPNRLVADDTYTLPPTVESPSGALYTVPTGSLGVAEGCNPDGECRSFKHRLIVSEVMPRNELFRSRVSF
jgi:Tfp pilus assembly protein PilV